ncbi:MAG: hypothetical protein HYU26_17700 [Candidatus Rokubacteria bacterium]|nr:hypothetical protein [Candidatus Rokubacteria bacterium]
MHCDICDAPMRERRATAKAPYYYVLGGLPHFAALLVVDPAHLSRVENGKQRALGPSTDRLARLIVTGFARGGEEVRKLLLAEAADRIERRKQTKTVATFKHEKNRWKVAA